MCLGKPKLPKAAPPPKMISQPAPALSTINPQVQSGADQQNAAKNDLKKNRKSLFQFDLTIPVGSSTSGSSGAGGGEGVGAGGASAGGA